MAQENEIVVLILAFGVWIFICLNRLRLKNIPSVKILITSYSMLSLAWIFTIGEGFFLSDLQNLLEHFCYMISAALMAVWCYRFRLLEE